MSERKASPPVAVASEAWVAKGLAYVEERWAVVAFSLPTSLRYSLEPAFLLFRRHIL